MAREIKLGNTVPDVTVTLGKHSYALRPMTKKVEEDLQPLSDAVNALIGTNATPQEVVETMAKQIDAMLFTSDGEAPKPSEVISEAFAKEQTTSADVEELCRALVLQTRPT